MSEDELTRLEADLLSLTPVLPHLDRDQLMFAAGLASKRSWVWPTATAVMSAVALTLGVILVTRPAPVDRVEYVTVPARPDPTPAPKPNPQVPTPKPAPAPYTSQETPWPERHGYFQLQDQVLRWGLDGLPNARPAPEPPRKPDTIESLLKSF